MIFQSVFSIEILERDRPAYPESSRVWGTRQVNPLADSITSRERERDTLTSRSVFVPRVPTGFPARRYSWLSIIARPPARLRHNLTRSDQPGVTTTHSAWSTPGTVSEKKNNRKENPPFHSLRPISKRTEPSVLRLSPSFVRKIHSLSQILFFFFRNFLFLVRIALKSITLAQGALVYLEMRAFSSILEFLVLDHRERFLWELCVSSNIPFKFLRD